MMHEKMSCHPTLYSELLRFLTPDSFSSASCNRSEIASGAEAHSVRVAAAGLKARPSEFLVRAPVRITAFLLGGVCEIPARQSAVSSIHTPSTFFPQKRVKYFRKVIHRFTRIPQAAFTLPR
jgi:hypothetical protein